MPTYEDERGYDRKIEVEHSNLVHRAIAYKEIYLKNRSKYPLPFSEYDVHHEDGNKKNNKIKNLKIVTRKEHNELHKKIKKKTKMKHKKINWIFESRIGKGILAIFLGLILVFGKEDIISTKTIGILIIIFSILFLIFEIKIYYQVKKSKKSKDIKNQEHSIIAYYLERHNITYVYLPKEEKQLTFLLPEYDVYIKYWEKETYDKEKRKKLLKKLKGNKTPIIELFKDNLISFKQLDWKFMQRILEALKKK